MSDLNQAQTPAGPGVSENTSPTTAELVLGNVHGWTIRLNYLRARLESPHSTSGELHRAEHELEEIRYDVKHARLAVSRMELEAGESSFAQDVKGALRRITAQIRAIDEIGRGAAQ